MHPCHTFFVGDDGWGHTIRPPVTLTGQRLREQVTVGTQAMADGFAAEIATRPADWHMLQPLWLADLASRVG